MSKLSEDLQSLVTGDVEISEDTIKEHSRDTSLFERTPEVVVFPRNADDIEAVVNYVRENKADNPGLSITARAAGSCMTGGPLNDSIILSTTKYMNSDHVDEDNLEAMVEPGLYYRDFEKDILPEHLTFPSYPASKRLAALGGILMNNSGGEKTLRYGQTRKHVKSVSMVLSDGKRYEFHPLNRDELNAKMAQDDFEGKLYREVFMLVDENYHTIKAARPDSSKNSAGYALWDVWDRETGVFDMTQLFVGSQGTLGVLARAKINLIKIKPHSKMVVAFFKSWDDLPEVVNAVLPFDPEEMETFDRDTLKLGLRFMPEIAKRAGESFSKFAARFIPEVGVGVKMLGMPKLIVLIELAENSEEEANKKADDVVEALKPFRVWTRRLDTEAEMNKYVTMRHESFALLREHVDGKRTAPFVEDFGIAVDKMPQFLPRALEILREAGIKANIAGHAGNGNYHIIPLMNFDDEKERAKIIPVADKIYNLIAEFGGTNTAEHNDGILRTPYLEVMYGKEINDLFIKVKQIFDPENIFNPGKKVGGTKEDIEKYMAKHN